MFHGVKLKEGDIMDEEGMGLEGEGRGRCGKGTGRELGWGKGRVGRRWVGKEKGKVQVEWQKLGEGGNICTECFRFQLSQQCSEELRFGRTILRRARTG